MPFETFAIYTAGYCLMRRQMPRCIPAPGNRYKFGFNEAARAVAAEFDVTQFASFADGVLSQMPIVRTWDRPSPKSQAGTGRKAFEAVFRT